MREYWGILAFVVLLWQGGQGEATPCPFYPTMRMVGDKGYVVTTSKIAFSQASSDCQSMNLELASVDNAAEFTLIKDYAGNVVDDHVWLNLHNPDLVSCTGAACDGQLKDVDGNPVATLSSLFDDVTVSSECVRMNKNGKIEDRTCTADAYAICQIVCAKTACPPWTNMHFAGDRHYLLLEDDKQSQGDAQTTCTTLGLRLASVYTSTEQSHVYSYLDFLRVINEVWTDAWNSPGTSCTSKAACQGQITDRTGLYEIDLSSLSSCAGSSTSGKKCETIKVDGGGLKMDSETCSTKKRILCESLCEAEHCLPPTWPTNTQLLSTISALPDALFTNQEVQAECVTNTFLDTPDKGTTFSITCQSDGSYVPWPNCVSTTTCIDPPGRPVGGTSDWDRQPPQADLVVTYRCGLHEQFTTGETELSTTCQWGAGNSWTVTSFSSCDVTGCGIISEPPDPTLLVYTGTNAAILSDYSEFTPTLPATLATPASFASGGTDQYLLEGHFLTSGMTTTLPIIEVLDSGAEVLTIILDPQNHQMTVEAITAGVAAETYQLGLDTEDPIRLTIVPDGLDFNIKLDSIGSAHTYSFPSPSTITFTDIRVDGSLTVDFVGFVPTGTSPGLLSGDLVSYECEADYGFADDPNLFATTVECMPDGTVTTHNPWPECLFLLWNAWEPWSTCSETCGNGVYVRSRTCGHPLVTCADLAYNVQYCNEAQCTNAENDYQFKLYGISLAALTEFFAFSPQHEYALGSDADGPSNLEPSIECAGRCSAFRATHDDWTACNAYYIDEAANTCKMTYAELDWLTLNANTGTENIYVDVILP